MCGGSVEFSLFFCLLCGDTNVINQEFFVCSEWQCSSPGLSPCAGVPFSTQWTADGHFYPIQIAQFGLSHYSKHLVEGEPEVLVMEDGEEEDVADWARPDKRARIRLLRDSSRFSNVVEFAASGMLCSVYGLCSL